MAKKQVNRSVVAWVSRGVWRWWWLLAGAGFTVIAWAALNPQVRRGWNRLFVQVWGENRGTQPGPSAAASDAWQRQVEKQVEQRLRAELEREYQQKNQQWQEQWLRQNNPADRDSAVSDLRQLRQGLPLEFKVRHEPGAAASSERERDDSYTARYELSWKRPQAVTTVEGLQRLNPSLTKVLPRLAQLIPDSAVSALFVNLYDRKQARLLQDATDLQALLSKHNLYDLETALCLRDPSTQRRVLLMQSDMDVVSDGSDGDRLAIMPDEIVNSANYQPFTSYAWKKTGTTENPMIAGWQNRIKNAEQESADQATTVERKRWLKERIAYLKRGIADMRARSFLIADHDPFIVLPVTWLAAELGADSVRPGDFCVVIHGERCFPAIVGDGGPNYKCGEASLRLAKEIDARTTPYRRPVTDLKVTYLIFPGSRQEQREAPNYAAWRLKCQQLLGEIGGLGAGVNLHEWSSTLPQVVASPLPSAASETSDTKTPTDPQPADPQKAPTSGVPKPAGAVNSGD